MSIDFETAMQLFMFVVAMVMMYLSFVKDSM